MASRGGREQGEAASSPVRPGVLFVLAWSAVAVFAWSRQAYLLDDAFISFRYAANWAAGHGPVFNPGERVEGYTNFLWMAAAAVVVRLGLDPVVWMRALGVAAYAATVGLCAALAWQLPGRDAGPWRRLATVPLLLALLLPDSLAGFAGTGLETSFVSLLVVVLGVSSFLWAPRAAWALVPLALLLTRLDMLPAVAIALALCALERSAARLWPFVAAGVGMAVYLAWKLSFYGELLPNSFHAKVGSFPVTDAGLAYLATWLQSAPQYLLLIAIIAVGCARATGARRRFLVFALTVAAVQAAYIVRVGGDFMQYRFMFHIYALVVAAGIVGLDAVALVHPRAAFVAAAAVALLSTRPAVLETRYHMESLPGMHACCAVTGVHYGRVLRQVLPRDTVISTSMVGALPYYADVTTIDELGLNDRTVAREGAVLKELRRGHMRYATEDYLRRRGVNLVFHHPTSCRCSEPCPAPGPPNVFVNVGMGLCLRGFYLTPTPALTDHFCSRPDVFVVPGSLCGERARPDRSGGEPTTPAVP